MKSLQKRGQLTSRIKVLSKKLLGYEINQCELRLMMHLQYIITNKHDIFDCKYINEAEEDILRHWEHNGYLNKEFGKVKITKKFWDIICEIIYLGYVDLN